MCYRLYGIIMYFFITHTTPHIRLASKRLYAVVNFPYGAKRLGKFYGVIRGDVLIHDDDVNDYDDDDDMLKDVYQEQSYSYP